MMIFLPQLGGSDGPAPEPIAYIIAFVILDLAIIITGSMLYHTYSELNCDMSFWDWSWDYKTTHYASAWWFAVFVVNGYALLILLIFAVILTLLNIPKRSL